MKVNKSKGKVHPSPSSSSSYSFSLSLSSKDPISALNLLPSAILTLISVLSLQDREVLAYLITCSLKSSTFINVTPKTNRNKSSSSPPPSTTMAAATDHHKSPSFDCDCFDCYTSYWFRWDSSPNRELIHQAIEAFEEHLSTSEKENKKKKKKTSGRSRRKEKFAAGGQSVDETPSPEVEVFRDVTPSLEVMVLDLPENIAGEESTAMEEEQVVMVEVTDSGEHKHQEQQKGLARKVLPGVIGFFNSRLWNLWGPTV